MKDRVEVLPERDSNYIQAADGHLIIIQAREKDRANYTCVAENVANRRLSPPARLNVHGKNRHNFFLPTSGTGSFAVTLAVGGITHLRLEESFP